MRQAILLNGSPLITAAGELPVMKDGHQDDFTRSDRPIDSPWVDASVQYPTMFNPVVIEDNRAAFYPLVSNGDTLLLGHHVIYQDIGISDNFEVGCTWVSDDSERLIGQVGPAAFIDPDSADPLEMGVWVNYDISIFGGTIYGQNVFRQTPISDVFNSSYYDVVISGSGNQGTFIHNAYPPTDRGAPLYYNKIALRVTSGMMQMYWNGKPINVAVAVPAELEGRTKVGIHVISAKVNIGETGLGGDTITEIIPDLADNWYWRPL